MSNWITGLATSVSELAAQADNAITEVEKIGRSGFVSSGIKDRKSSQLFTDDGVLKFYNATDGTIKTVTL